MNSLKECLRKDDIMEYVRNNYQIEDPRISVKDLCKYVLRHWVPVAGLAIAGMIFFAVYSGKKLNIMKDEEINKALSDITQIQADEEIKNISLSADEAEQYEGMIAAKESIVKDSAEYAKYLENAIYMSINPTEVKSYTLDVRLETVTANAASYAPEIGKAYAAYLTAESGYLKEVAEKYNTEESYIKELLSVTFDGSVYNTTASDGTPVSDYIVRIRAVSNSEELSEEIANAAYSEFEKHKVETDGRYGPHVISAVDVAAASYEDQGIAGEQQNRRNTNMNMINSMNDYQNKINSFVLNKVKKVHEDEMRNPETGFNKKSALKGGILGFVAGAGLMVLFYALFYMIGDKFISATAFSNHYHIDILTEGEANVKNGVVAAALANANPDYKSIVIVGQAAFANKEILAEALKKDDVKCEVFERIKDNVQALNALADADTLIFAEQKGKSSYMFMNEELVYAGAESERYTGAVLF